MCDLICNSITCSVLGFCIFMCILFTIDYFSKSDFFCKNFGWHKAPLNRLDNEACPRCNKQVIQDKHKNWV